jgi:hypothetical protein
MRTGLRVVMTAVDVVVTEAAAARAAEDRRV